MIKNIMKNIGLKPVEVEEKEEVKEDVLPSELNEEKEDWRKRWEERAANSSETIASLKNFIKSMQKPEAKVNPHADEIVEIYKKELEHRQKDPKYRPETVYLS